MPSHKVCWTLLFLLASLSLIALSAPAQNAGSAVGGSTRLYNWPEDPRNLAANPSFETQDSSAKPSLWVLGSPENWALVSSPRHSGRRSLQLKNSHLSSTTPLARQQVQLVPGWYNLRAFLKTSQAGTLKAGSGGRLSLWKGASGESTAVVFGTTDWIQVSRNSVLVEPLDAPSIRLEAYRKPDGFVWFDDVALHQLIPPLVEGFVLYPNYRGMLFQDRSQTVRVSVTAHPDVIGQVNVDTLVRLTLEDQSGAVFSGREQLVAPNSPALMTLDASNAPLGTLRLRLIALDAKNRNPLFEYPAYQIVKLPSSARASLKTYVNDQNALVIDGVPRFALGIYDTSGRSALPNYYEPRVSKIAEAPFNLYLNYWLGGASLAQIQALTTTLRKYRMSYLHTVNNWYEDDNNWPAGAICSGLQAGQLGQTRFTACKAAELRDLPGLAGWYTADERPADQASRVFNQYSILRSIDLDGVTFIAQNSPKELARWRDVADVIGVDKYPIYNVPEGEFSPLENVTASVETAQSYVERSRPVWAVIQFFQHGSKGHWPTYDELRTMSYMAIVGGAKGLFYWSNGAGALAYVKDPELREEYWQRLVRVTKEIAALEPVFLAPNAVVLSSVSQGDRIRVLTKQAGHIRFVIAVNNSATEQPGVEFHLKQQGTLVNVYAENRVIPMTGLSFVDTFEPYAVHVYVIR